MGRFRMLGLFVLAMAFSGSTIALSTPAHDLFERQSTCRSGYTQCSGVPSGFCCGPSTTCLVLANNTTLLCCPSGDDCSIIAPVTCDIQEQNVTLHNDAILLTTNLTATLQNCGGACCPLGYSCSGSACMINANQGSAPSHTNSITGTSTPTVISVLSSTSVPPTAPAVTANPSATQTNPSTVQADCNAFPVSAILAGFFPGMFAGALIACAGFCLFGAHRRKQARLSGSFGKVSASISDPIYQGSAMRTDFIRKQNSAPSSPSRQPTIQRVRSLFRRSAAANGTEMAMNSSPVSLPHPQGSPRTPRLQREPSGESINIFADPSTAREGSRGRESHQTTFTDMMRRADLPDVRQGEPFVPKLSPTSYNASPRGRPGNGQ
jgi:hypothetical protein